MTDAKNDAKSDQVVAELENIDDECDQKVIEIVLCNIKSCLSFFLDIIGNRLRENQQSRGSKRVRYR